MQVNGPAEDERNRVPYYDWLLKSHGYSSSKFDPNLKILKFSYQYITKWSLGSEKTLKMFEMGILGMKQDLDVYGYISSNIDPTAIVFPKMETWTPHH